MSHRLRKRYGRATGDYAGTPRFRLFLADGRSVLGVVQGSGGFVKALARLAGGIRRAKRGEDSGFYEPRPGHIAVFTQFSAASNGPERIVNMRQVVAVRAIDTDNAKVEKV